MIPENYGDRVMYYINRFSKRNLAEMLASFTLKYEGAIFLEHLHTCARQEEEE